MKTKRILSLFIALVMVLGTLVVPQMAMAYEKSGLELSKSENRADISFVYLGTTKGTGGSTISNLELTSKTLAEAPLDLNETDRNNQTIWVGVQLSNMSKAYDLLNPSKSTIIAGANSKTIANDGLYGLDVGITYNSKYLTPYTYSNPSTLYNNLLHKSYPDYEDADEGTMHMYEIQAFNSGTASSTQYSEPCSLPTDDGALNYLAMKVRITAREASFWNNHPTLKRMFQADTAAGLSDEPVVIAAFPFVLAQKIPEDGAKVLQGSLSFETFTITTGYAANTTNGDVAANWQYNPNSSTETNLKNYFNVTDADGNLSDGTINIFPSKYQVRYYNDEDKAKAAYDNIAANGADADTSHVAVAPVADSGVELLDDSTVGTLPDLSTFTKPAANKVISGFKFVDKRVPPSVGEGEDPIVLNASFDENTKMGSCYADAKHIIYVYPEWVDGTPVVFNSNYAAGMSISTPVTDTTYIYEPTTEDIAVSSDVVDAAETKVMTGVTGWSIEGWYYSDTDFTAANKVAFTALDNSRKTAIDGETNQGYALYANWTQQYAITVHKNDGSDNDVITTLHGIPGNATTDTLTDPTREDGYEFNGWSTAANGSNTPFKTTAEVLAEAFTANGDLYAQWVPAADQDQVVIAFDKNNVDTSGATEPNPTPVTIKLGDALGTKMPNDPARTNYTFEGWNTQADGKGTEVTDTKAITADDFTFENTDSPYDLTLYAQWKLDETKVTDDADKVTLTFYKNENGKLGTDTTDVYATYKIKKNDALGFVPGPVTNSAHQYSATFTDWSTTGKADGTVFDDTAAAAGVNANAQYYAAWDLTVIAGVYDDAQANKINTAPQYLYTGAEIEPAYIIYEQGNGDGVLGDVIDSTASGDTLKSNADFGVIYYKTSELTNTDKTAVALRNVLPNNDTYSPFLTAKTGGAYDGFHLVPASKSEITIVNSDNSDPEHPQATTLTPVIDTDKQSWKVGDTVVSPLARVQGLVGEDITTVGADTTVSNDIYDVKYYTFVDDGNGTVEETELTETTLANIITKSATDEGKYVIKIELKGDYVNNYTLRAADASSADGTVAVYTGTGVDHGQNMKLEVAKGKPWITDLKVTSDIVGVYPDNTYTEADKIGGKGDSILTGATEPTPDEDSILAEDYAVRGGSTQTEVKINIKLSEDIPEADIADRVVVTGGKADTAPAFTKEEDGSWTITVQLGSNDPTNPDKITITTKESDKNTDGFAYEFEVQTLKALPTIAFKPGNSPFGLIERMSTENGGTWDADRVKAAKDGFVVDTTYGNYMYNKTGSDNPATTLVPDHAQTDFNYTVRAWGFTVDSVDPGNNDWSAINDPENNLDLNDRAVFVYQSDEFVDPGFTIYDQAGVAIENPTITKEIQIKTLADSTVPLYRESESTTDETVSEVDGIISLKDKVIRPDKYTIVYTVKYTDKVTNTEKTLVLGDTDGDGTVDDATQTRPIAIISKRGDILLTQSPGINSQDADSLVSNWADIIAARPIFSFRSADINISEAAGINSQDGDDLTSNWSELLAESAIQFYDSSLLK